MPDATFCRTLRPGMRGPDVIAHKRAISHAVPTTYPWYAFTDYYGPAFQAAVKVFQHQHGIPQTGVIGSTTHAALVKARQKNHPEELAFDAFAVRLAHDFCAKREKTPEQRVREAIVAAGFYWYGHRAQIAYSQSRPFWLGHPPGVPSRLDCSGYVTLCHYAGGGNDPNRRHFDGLGYTGTLMGGGTRVATFDDLDIADLVFYGYSSGRPGFNRGDPTHVAMKADATHVLSMGSYPMGYYPFDYRHDINHFRRYEVSTV